MNSNHNHANNIIAARCRKIIEWCSKAVKKIAKEGLQKFLEYTVNLIICVILGIFFVFLLAYFPTKCQSPIVLTLKKFGVPEWIVPDDPKGYTYSIKVGDAGFGYMTLFHDAGTYDNEIIHLDSDKIPYVIVCHNWTYVGKSATDALKAFVRQHPNCFSMKDRPGGGIEIQPIEIQGDFIYGNDRRIIAFACECRSNLEQVKVQFFRDQGLGITAEPNNANTPDAKSRAAD